MKYSFEYLPNELILQIFLYFDLRNLYWTFWGLNRRLNHLLLSLPNLSFIYENEIDSSLIYLFAQRISRLKLPSSQSIDFSTFSRLQSLELCRATDYQLDQIRSDLLPNLKSLLISTQYHITLPGELIQEIFSKHFSSLEQVQLNRLDTFSLSFKSQSLSLKILQITCTNPNVISRLLIVCPNLLKFSVKFFGQNRHILPPLGSTYNHNLQEFSLSDPHHRLTFETIEILFLYIPNIKSLDLEFQCRVPFIDLIQTILNRLIYLEEFNCKIIELFNHHMIDLHSIQQMHDYFQPLQCLEKDNHARFFFTE